LVPDVNGLTGEQFVALQQVKKNAGIEGPIEVTDRATPGNRFTVGAFGAPGTWTLDQLDIVVTMRGVGFPLQQIRRMLTAKEPDSAEERIKRARALLAELGDQIAEQRRRLDAADALLHSWEQEIIDAGY